MDLRRIGYKVYRVPPKNVFSKVGKRTVNLILEQRLKGEKGIRAAMYEISEIIQYETYLTPKRITPPYKSIN